MINRMVNYLGEGAQMGMYATIYNVYCKDRVVVAHHSLPVQSPLLLELTVHERQGMDQELRIHFRCVLQSSQDRRESTKMLQILSLLSALFPISLAVLVRLGLTKVDMVFSILVVRLSMMMDNSSSVMSSRIDGPRYDGGGRCCGMVLADD